MLKSKNANAEINIAMIRQENIKNWTDEDRAFYDDFLSDIPDTEDATASEGVSPNANDSWEKFRKRNKKLLSRS